MNNRDQNTENENLLDATAYGADIPAIKMAALDAARRLYGPDARLQIEHVGTISTSSTFEGQFLAHVTVRRLDGGES